MILTVPAYDSTPWPTLGEQVCDFIEAYLVYGPGDLRGSPAILGDEQRMFIYRMYEVYPKGHRLEGRRRFKRVCLSLRKGTAKTEFAAWIAAVELHPDGPVRCDGFDADGDPVGRSVTDPYIPMVAYTEDQTEELAYGALKAVLEESSLADDFDIGLERIMRKNGAGKAEALSSSPNANDGARTTFQHFDETHRFVLPRLKQAHKTMLANIPKRFIAVGWSLETTTAPEPGSGSIAEATMDYARAIDEGQDMSEGAVEAAQLFFYHRQASEIHNLATAKGLRDAVMEASGPAAEWSDIESIIAMFGDPTSDRAYIRRVWLNQLVRSSDKAFDIERWKELEDSDFVVPDGELIVLGFDGSRSNDATALVATGVASGYQWPVGVWERPYNITDWEVPSAEVDEAVAAAYERWDVWRMYCDPPYWEGWVSAWAGRYGDKRVIEWWTNRTNQMAYALKAFETAINTGEISHSGDATLTRHIGNAHKRYLKRLDDEGKPLWWIQKERSDSPYKIDACMAAVLSWEARGDAVTAGATGGKSIYETRGLITL